MSRLTRDGTAEPVSRDQILRHARGQGDIFFPVQLTTSRIGNLTRLIHTLLYVMTIHTMCNLINTYIHTTVVPLFCYDWWLCMVINISGVSPRHYTAVDPRLLTSRNPFKYHVEALSFQPMKQYIITTMLGMLYCIISVLLFVWCPCMAINVSVQYNGGLLPDIIRLLTQCYHHRGTRLNAMKRFLYLQPMIPPKRFDIFPPDWGMLRRSRRVQIFLIHHKRYQATGYL